jgi:hypothetical protein
MKVSRNKPTLLLIAAAIVIAAWLFWESVSQPGNEQWSGKIEEIGFYRNENNTGPIRRIYAVFVMEGSAEEMRSYADHLPYTKYGTTTVFFFTDRNFTPTQLRGDDPYFDTLYRPYCIARFEKNSMGQVLFTRNPFE